MRDHSLSIKLFISLSVLLIVTVIIFIIISDYAVMNSSKSEISKNYIGKLKVAENTVLQLKDAINRDTTRLSVNNAINALNDIMRNGEKITSTQNLLKLSTVIDIILEAVNTNSSYYSMYLYLEDLGYSITSNQGFVPNTELKDTGWLKYYRDYKENGTPLSWVETRLPYDNSNYIDYLSPDCVITYIYPLTPYTTNLQGALVVNVREDVICRLINSNNLSREGYMFIINSKGNVISHVDKQFLCKDVSNLSYIKEILNSQSDDGYLETKINGRETLVSFYKSSNNDWIYVGVFSLESLIGSVNHIRMYTIYLSILIVAIGVAVAYFISNRLYSPVKKLIQDIKLTKGIDILEAGDEMAILRKAFDTLKKYGDNLSDELEKSKQNIRESYLNGLLRGKYPCESIDDNILKLDFKYPYFICTVMSIDRYREFSKTYDTEKQHYLKMLVLNIAEEVINQSFNCIGVNMDNGEIALIINVSSSQSDKLQESLGACFHIIQKETKKVLDYTISVGIGSCHNGDFEIKNSYMEASEALKYKLIYGYGSVIAWHKRLMERKYYYPFNIERHILNHIAIKDIRGIEDTVNGLMDEIKNKIGLSSDNVRQIFIQLVGNTVIRYLIDSNIDMSRVFGNSFNIYNELSKKETLDDIHHWLVDVYSKVINYCSKHDSNDKDKVHMIMDYIQKNYKNDIGIQDIADHVGLSYSHVRKIFKDETGKSIVDYINSIRIKEAKNLLVFTDISIKDLSASLGYNSDQSFSRTFKKLEGVTPGEYRTKNKGK